MYLRFVFIVNGEVLLGNNIFVVGMLFVFGVIVVYVKSKEINKKVFVLVLFFMVVVMIFEWVLVFWINDIDWLYLMVILLLLCNVY